MSSSLLRTRGSSSSLASSTLARFVEGSPAPRAIPSTRPFPPSSMSERSSHPPFFPGRNHEIHSKLNFVTPQHFRYLATRDFYSSRNDFESARRAGKNTQTDRPQPQRRKKKRAGCAQPPFDRTVDSRSLPAPITANHTTPCARSFTSRPARPATRLEPSSGRYDARFRSASGSLSAELRTTNLRTKPPSGPLSLADHLGGARD